MSDLAPIEELTDEKLRELSMSDLERAQKKVSDIEAKLARHHGHDRRECDCK